MAKIYELQATNEYGKQGLERLRALKKDLDNHAKVLPVAEMKKCMECGREFQEYYCSNCKMKMTIYCTHCHSELHH